MVIDNIICCRIEKILLFTILWFCSLNLGLIVLPLWPMYTAVQFLQCKLYKLEYFLGILSLLLTKTLKWLNCYLHVL